jgi:hypothetical protein
VIRQMALHRDIYWLGRQWAVTGYGLQLIDQKLQGFFDIEASRLWEGALIESMHAKQWLNREDFDKGLALARERHSQPPRESEPPSPELAGLPSTGANPVPPPLGAPTPEEPRVPRADPVAPSPKIAEPIRAEPINPRPVEGPKPAPPKVGIWIASGARLVTPWRVRIGRYSRDLPRLPRRR